MSPARGVVAWCGPAALALVSARVFAGDALAPVVALIVAVGPLVALVRWRDTTPRSSAHAALALPGLAGFVVAHAAAIADFARRDALPPWLAAALVLGLALAAFWPGSATGWRSLGGIGLVAMAAPVVLAAGMTMTSPWSAWRQVASRPTLAFAERSHWVTEGGAVARSETFVFDEPHRVTAVTPAVWRVSERDGARVTLRERRLNAGESIVLRPGDRLSVDAGSRLRFEPGKRVPGAVASGVAWADPPARGGVRGVLGALGVVFTVGGGALAVVPSARSTGAFVTAVAPAAALFAVAAGTYAMYVAPDIALTASATAVLHDLPRATLGGSGGALVAALVGVGFLASFAVSAGAAAALARGVLATVAPTRSGAVGVALWVTVALGAGAGAFRVIDPERILMLSLGALASTWTAPLLAAASPRATLLGAAIGAVVFALLAVVAPPEIPALIAAPAAWATAAILGRTAEDEDR